MNKASDPLLLWLYANNYSIKELNAQGNYGNTALMKAAREGRADLVKELLEFGVDIAIKNVDGNTALWLSCFSNNLECARLLIEAGIELDTQNVNGVTSLMYTASSGKEEFVSLLVENGANTKTTNDDDFTALDLACTRDIIKILRNA